MSLNTPTELKAAAPEFASVLDATVQIYLDNAFLEIDEDAWGSRAEEAEQLLACHKMIVMGVLSASGGGSTVGPISSKSVGDVSVSYAATATLGVQQGLDVSLSGSKYGAEYARLIRLAAMGAVLDGS